jgi:hypothetical protein
MDSCNISISKLTFYVHNTLSFLFKPPIMLVNICSYFATFAYEFIYYSKNFSKYFTKYSILLIDMALHVILSKSFAFLFLDYMLIVGIKFYSTIYFSVEPFPNISSIIEGNTIGKQ